MQSDTILLEIDVIGLKQIHFPDIDVLLTRQHKSSSFGYRITGPIEFWENNKMDGEK